MRRDTECFSMYSPMSMRTMCVSSSNRNSASARASSVLPTPVGPRKMNEPIGRFGSCRPGARAAHGVGDGLDGLLLADDALVQPLLHLVEPRHLALEHLLDGDAGPLGDDGGDVLLGHLFAQERRAAFLGLLERLVGLGELLLAGWAGCRSAARRRGSRSPRRCASSASVLALSISSLALRMAAMSSFSRCHCAFMPVDLLRRARRSRARPPRAASCDCLSSSFDSACRSISSDTMRRCRLSIGVGSESISIFRRDAASSIRSIALSGRKRSWM